jgi:hypothetical protein
MKQTKENTTAGVSTEKKGDGVEIIRNLDYLKYTFEHRIAVRYLLEKFKSHFDADTYEELQKRVRFHDLDKAFLYLFCDKPTCSNFHKLTAKHHMRDNNLWGLFNPHTLIDYYEAVLDYESAAYTKKDKPLNAFDTIMHVDWMTDVDRGTMIQCVKELGIASSYRNSPNDPKWLAFRKTQPEATFENIFAEILDFIKYGMEDYQFFWLTGATGYPAKMLEPETIRKSLDATLEEVEITIKETMEKKVENPDELSCPNWDLSKR